MNGSDALVSARRKGWKGIKGGNRGLVWRERRRGRRVLALIVPDFTRERWKPCPEWIFFLPTEAKLDQEDCQSLTGYVSPFFSAAKDTLSASAREIAINEHSCDTTRIRSTKVEYLSSRYFQIFRIFLIRARFNDDFF